MVLSIYLSCISCKLELSSQIVTFFLKKTDDISRRDRAIELYDKFLLDTYLRKQTELCWCPNNCGFGFIAKNFNRCPKIICQNCSVAFCYFCKTVLVDEKHECSGSTSVKGTLSHRQPRNRLLNTIHEVRKFVTSFANVNVDQPTSDKIATSSGKIPEMESPSWQSCDSDLNKLAPGEKEESTSWQSCSSSMNIKKANQLKNKNETSQLLRHDSILSLPSFVELDSKEESTESSSVDTKTEHNQGQMKQCPKCSTYVLKLQDGTCNHVTCSICKCEFCWLCSKEINYLHYLSLSGCTFWGRRQWSLRRRIVLVLVLALMVPPLLIIVLGIALPSIIIGFPVFTGLDLKKSLQNKPRNIKIPVIFFSILLCIILAPLVALFICTLTFFLCLGCVYIYMPISTVRFYFAQRRAQAAKRYQTSHAESLAYDSTTPPATIEWSEVLKNDATNEKFNWDRLANASGAHLYQKVDSSHEINAEPSDLQIV
ncbi:hypothetical protein Ciccas_011873 [Cichlidogyrus casuarinus]|uniref:RBR-type E3 ubiquitin transferase n=1 Tax=Cichlidogyrus casuarinus TaxID=1844966 RepID=A0ABD2PT19_9PLAT